MRRERIGSQENGKRRAVLPCGFVPHPLRHTMLTRLGETGVDDDVTIMIAGHSSIVVSQPYIRPTPKFVQRAFDSLQRGNQRAVTDAKNSGTSEQVPATLFATSDEAISLSN